MLQGFKDFILRGNVIELAVAVVIGSAFQKVVDQVVTNLVTPVINAAGNPQTSGLGFLLRPDMPKTYMDFSAIINALIVFLLTAAVVYFVFVVPMNKLAERRKRGVEPEPEAPSEEILLLQEIRDLLRNQSRPGM